jgi:uncharacterized protein YndB with AHSA1/START domain
MADILHDFFIAAARDRVFQSISTPEGFDAWWTKRSSGRAALGAEFELWFGPEYDWRARVTRCAIDEEFEIEITRADADWTGTRVGFHLQDAGGGTRVRFFHVGWPDANDHFRASNYCWAMYLRVLRRYLEHGEVVPYEHRNDV